MRRILLIAVMILIAGAVSLRSQSSQSSTAAGGATATADTLSLSSGQTFVIELETPLHSRASREGDDVYFNTREDVRINGRVVMPRGTSVHAVVTRVKRPGRIKGRAEISLRFNEIRLADGTTLPLKASVQRAGFSPVESNKQGDPSLKGESGSGGNVGVIAKGGLQGVILGGVFGGRKGAAYGGAVGAGIGLAGILLQRGPDLDLPRSTLFEISLDETLRIPSAVADRSTQIARNSQPATYGSPGGYPSRDDDSTDSRPEPVPDFSRDGEPKEPAAAASTSTATGTDSSLPSPAVTGGETNADPGAFKLSVNVQLVLVDAVVRDRIGRPMDNLKREDFRLFEDGIEQPVRDFSRDELPLAVAIVVDRSGSVARYMNDLRRAAYRALTQLKPGDQVALFAFAGDVQRLEDLTTDRQRIANRIAGIRAGGGTNIIDALFEAVYYLGNVAPDRRRAVILVSDNQATTRPRASQGQTIRMAMESETVVYSIKTPGEGTPLTMRIPVWLSGTGSVAKVAQETGGEIIDVESTGSLDAALAAVVSRLKLRYTLGYYPGAPAAAGTFRKIEVRLSERFGRPGDNYTVSARTGYYTPGGNVAAGSRP